MAIEVRALRPDDQDRAGRATAEAYREFAPPDRRDWEDYLRRVADVDARSRHATVLVAEDDGDILGTVTVEVDGRIPGGHERPPLRPGEAHVRMLGVRPEARRRGAARALMEAANAHARRAGKTMVTLDTTEAMAAAHRLYESMGFRRSGERVFDDGFRLLSYELPLR